MNRCPPCGTGVLGLLLFFLSNPSADHSSVPTNRRKPDPVGRVFFKFHISYFKFEISNLKIQI